MEILRQLSHSWAADDDKQPTVNGEAQFNELSSRPTYKADRQTQTSGKSTKLAFV